jgi:uncharacterized protein YkwD
MRRIFQISICCTIALLTTFCSADDSEYEVEKPVDVLIEDYNYNDSELEVMELVNSYRIKIGLTPLIKINHISYKSEEHCRYMISHRAVNHDNFAARSENIMKVTGAYKVGENVAYNYKTSEAALAAWLASGEHKKNIEGDFTHFGIAVKIDAENGRKYYTNIFAKIER